MELTEEQTDYVFARLEEEGLRYAPLQEELGDHICCEVEKGVAEGKEFQQAVSDAFSRFGTEEIRQLQRQTIRIVHQKPLIMKIVSLMALSLMLVLPLSHWLSQQEVPNLHPLGKGFEITSGFGLRTHPISKEKKMHKGIDFIAPAGTPVLATADGRVSKVAYKEKSYGHYIIIDHGDGYETLYSQLSATKVKEGQGIEKGKAIGLTGSSGFSTGPHLHYEVRKDGKNLDPELFLGE